MLFKFGLFLLGTNNRCLIRMEGTFEAVIAVGGQIVMIEYRLDAESGFDVANFHR